jgi:hypothetical protein
MRQPQSIAVASSAIALAVGAGITESVFAIAHFAAAGAWSPADAVQVAVRAVVYGAGLALTALLYFGHRWSRWALLIMFGLLWSVTLVIPMAGELASGESLRLVFGGDVNPAFPYVRALHLMLVPIGLIAMFRGSASTFLRNAGRARAGQLIS